MAYHGNYDGSQPPNLSIGRLHIYWLGPSWYHHWRSWVFSAQKPFIGERLGSINFLWLEFSY